jgi:hypothetical protein
LSDTLLAEALIGDPDKGLLPGRRPDPRVVAAARDRPVDPSAALTEGAFDLSGWRALRPDGTLPESSPPSYNDGVPADVEPFEGVRVLLLGRSPSVRTWDAGRRFEDMPADLRIVETLTPASAAGWLGRIAAAAPAPKR